MNLEIYATLRGGGRGGVTRLCQREHVYDISNQHCVCKFEDMGWDIF